MTAAAAAARPTRLQAWKLAIRPPTLTAAVAPILVGSAVAIQRDEFRVLPALAALFGAICLQVGANFANDVFDFKRGADTPDRLGPPRVTQTGMLSAREVFAGMWLVFALAMLAGIYLVVEGGWPIIAVGLASIAAAIIYTGGPWPIGYHALGDLFTFAFFGVVAVVGTYYVQAQEVAGAAWYASLPVGCTVTAILVVNNLRDIPTDRRTGKRTLGVLLGDPGTRTWYLLLVSAAVLLAILAWPLGFGSWPVLLSLGAIPALLPAAGPVFRGVSGRPLNLSLKATARAHLVLSALFALGLALS